MLHTNENAYYEALLARDSRYDGHVFVAVKTTGIYCRTICPAPKPKRTNCLYYKSAAAARHAGFRPCKRCRPETAPNSPAWVGTQSTVRRALRLIASGALNQGSLEDLATRLGVSSRHLRRLFKAHLGASPQAVAQTQRLHLAKQLLERTKLSMTDVAGGAGYGSQRRFNEEIKSIYGVSASRLRDSWKPRSTPKTAIDLKLGVRQPFDWNSLLKFFAKRAINGIEVIGEKFERTVTINDAQGVLIADSSDDGAMLVQLNVDQPTELLLAVEKIRSMFDLDAETENIENALCTDQHLKSTIMRNKGLRVPGTWNSFELSVRAIIGQQITVSGAQTILNRLSTKLGTPLSNEKDAFSGTCCRLFPTAEQISQANLSNIGLTSTRAKTLKVFSTAVASRDLLIDETDDPEIVIQALMGVPGIGPWTANYIAMRGLKYPDAFPAGDSGLLAAAQKLGIADSQQSLSKVADRWRPWRSYAAMHLWQSLKP